MDGEYVLSWTRSLVRWMWGDAWGLKRYGGNGSELIDDPAQRQRCNVCKNMHTVPLCFSRTYPLWWFKHATIYFFSYWSMQRLLLLPDKIISARGPPSASFSEPFKPCVSGRIWREKILSPCFWLYNCQSLFLNVDYFPRPEVTSPHCLTISGNHYETVRGYTWLNRLSLIFNLLVSSSFSDD